MSGKIKVLHLIKSLGRGGAEMLLPETLKLHDHSKFEFHYIYFLPWKNQLENEIRNSGGVVSCFSASNNVQIIFKIWAVVRYVRVHNIQLVHCHLPWAGFLGRLLFRFKKIPVIYTEHNIQNRYHRITYWINKLTFNWQRMAIAVSEEVRESILKNIKPKISIRTLLNGVNTDTFKRNVESGRKIRELHKIPTGALVIGTIAVFRTQKRLVEWLEVAKGVLAKNGNVFFIIVGDGPLKESILSARQHFGLEERVIMPGLQTDVKPWLSAMDIFMMTSSFEGLPIAMLEAMSMQCAVVATNAGGTREVIDNNDDGLIVEVNDYRLLVGGIESLVDSKRRSELTNRARAKVEKHFSITRMVHELENLYQNISDEVLP